MVVQPDWGEFLDAEWYYPDPPPTPAPGWTSDPWRTTAPDAVLVPRTVLEAVAQQPRIRFCLVQDQEWLAEIRDSIERRGIQHPFELVVDDTGRMVLRDGHHRLIATRDWEHFDLLPCRLIRSENIRIDAGLVADHLRTMLIR